ncbi:MAG: HPP family protein [Candidatus Omnitrophota bacterium]
MLAIVAVFCVLMLLDIKSNAAIIASLGASAFIAFTQPDEQRSQPRFLVGGYIVGIISGCICYGISQIMLIQNIHFFGTFLMLFFSAFAVGLSMFLMVITNTEHPPATGLALGLFLNGCQFRSIMVILIGIIALSIVKKILKPFLTNLI